jgi:HEPN domain-containing protein
MAGRAGDWFRQAERDLEQAADCRTAGRHEWACFAAHQGAEKAVKALHLRLGQEAWGHVVAKLLRELPATTGVADGLVEQGRVLDNSHPEGAPFEYYGPLQSEEALRFAGAIADFVRLRLA